MWSLIYSELPWIRAQGEHDVAQQVRDVTAAPRGCDWTEDRRGSNKRGITPDFVPEEYVAESILPGWEI